MELKNIRASGMQHGTETVTFCIEEWSGNLRHHVRQQAIQSSMQEIDVQHDIKQVDFDHSKWRYTAILLDSEDWELGDLFTADRWSYTDDAVEVMYQVDATQQMQEVAQRVEDAIVDAIADETPFGADMLNLSQANLREATRDRAVLEI